MLREMLVSGARSPTLFLVVAVFFRWLLGKIIFSWNGFVCIYLEHKANRRITDWIYGARAGWRVHIRVYILAIAGPKTNAELKCELNQTPHAIIIIVVVVVGWIRKMTSVWRSHEFVFVMTISRSQCFSFPESVSFA